MEVFFAVWLGYKVDRAHMTVDFHSICRITSLLIMVIDNESSVYKAGSQSDIRSFVLNNDFRVVVFA